MRWIYDTTSTWPGGTRLALLVGIPWIAVLIVTYYAVTIPLWLEYQISKRLRRVTSRPLPPSFGDVGARVEELRPTILGALILVILLASGFILVSLFSLGDEPPEWVLSFEEWCRDLHEELMEVAGS
ncbi:MAG: hypothetical protein GY788_28350 [bacterium]|nr:hypothetical protein [bacterium]